MLQKDPLSVKAGKNLKRIIKERGLTQEQFAELKCVDVTTVRRWITYGIDKLHIIEEIAEFFNLSVMDILK